MKSAHDAYISKAADFAVPILEKIRTAMHKACPNIEETMKWGHPHYDHNGIMAGMSAFKTHVNFGFSSTALHVRLPASLPAPTSESP